MNNAFRLLKGLLFLGFIPLYLITLLILLFGPVMTFSDILSVNKYQVPKTDLLPLLFFISFILYLSARIKTFKKIYHKIPVLWPLCQMLFIGTTGFALGLFFMNLWAENEVISRPIAIVLAIISVLLTRLFLSYWYKKYPISVKMFK
ncbi:hypothetical protein AB3N04_01380 [Alkalihalophilus sp. As8PL]|uniref:Uncharacterized protein n=1 Tax=Alkalihalophilus sp. As8PL TaxID=3237103 RepID=A0AB39BTP0_9BACI